MDIEEKPVKQLTCCVCGAYTKGRQWHNRDTGYGLCSSCNDWLRFDRNVSDAEMTDMYGVHGQHYCIEENAAKPVE